MIAQILSSDPFLKMAKTVIWWALAALIILAISYFSGVLSHPLMRAKKRVSKFRVLSISMSSTLKAIKVPPQSKNKLIKCLRRIMKKKKSIITSLNVYIYDDTANNLNSGFTKNCLNIMDDRLRHALSSMMENDFITASKDLEESAGIALELYKRLDEIVKKESNDRLLKI